MPKSAKSKNKEAVATRKQREDRNMRIGAVHQAVEAMKLLSLADCLIAKTNTFVLDDQAMSFVQEHMPIGDYFSPDWYRLIRNFVLVYWYHATCSCTSCTNKHTKFEKKEEFEEWQRRLDERVRTMNAVLAFESTVRFT